MQCCYRALPVTDGLILSCRPHRLQSCRVPVTIGIRQGQSRNKGMSAHWHVAPEAAEFPSGAHVVFLSVWTECEPFIGVPGVIWQGNTRWGCDRSGWAERQAAHAGAAAEPGGGRGAVDPRPHHRQPGALRSAPPALSCRRSNRTVVAAIGQWWLGMMHSRSLQRYARSCANQSGSVPAATISNISVVLRILDQDLRDVSLPDPVFLRNFELALQVAAGRLL